MGRNVNIQHRNWSDHITRWSLILICVFEHVYLMLKENMSKAT